MMSIKKLLALIVALSSPMYAHYELRGLILSVQSVCNTLEAYGAEFKGEYSFTDSIYQPLGKIIDLNREFVRMRVYQKTNWNQKKFVICHKIKEVPRRTGVSIFSCECNSLEEAEKLLGCCGAQFLFSFARTGYEYSLQGMKLFVEDIEGLPATIEAVASGLHQITELFEQIDADIVHDSVANLVFQAVGG